MRVKRAAHLPGPYGGYEKKTHFQPFFLRTASLCRRSRARRFVAYFDSLVITQNGANGTFTRICCARNRYRAAIVVLDATRSRRPNASSSVYIAKTKPNVRV